MMNLKFEQQKNSLLSNVDSNINPSTYLNNQHIPLVLIESQDLYINKNIGRTENQRSKSDLVSSRSGNIQTGFQDLDNCEKEELLIQNDSVSENPTQNQRNIHLYGLHSKGIKSKNRNEMDQKKLISYNYDVHEYNLQRQNEINKQLNSQQKYMKKLDMMLEKDLKKKENLIKQKINFKENTQIQKSHNGTIQIYSNPDQDVNALHNFSNFKMNVDLQNEIDFQKQIYQKNKKSNEKYNFGYQFYEADRKHDIQPTIDQNNQVILNHQNRLKQQLKNLSTAFVMSKLAVIDNELGFSELTKESISTNKLTWSKMFIKQPKIQILFNSYFEQMNQYINSELMNNQQQLQDFIQFPRNLKVYNQEQSSIKSAADLQMSMMNQMNRSVTSKEQRDQVLNYRQNKNKQLRSKTGKLPKNSKAQNQIDKNAKFQQDQNGMINSRSKDVFESELQTQTDSKRDDKRLVSANTNGASKVKEEISAKFFDELPPVLREKNKKMIDNITSQIQIDPKIFETYKSITSNSKLLFGDKLDQLLKLSEQIEMRLLDKEHRFKIHKSLTLLNQQLEDIDNEGTQFENQIMSFQEESYYHKIKRKMPMQKLLKDLQALSQELDLQGMSSFEQQHFASKVWDIYYDFEEQVRSEERGWQIHKKQINLYWRNQISKQKTQYLFRIEALEAALIETKLNCSQQIEQAIMELNHFESQQSNLQVQGRFKNFDEFVEKEYQKFNRFGIKNINSSRQNQGIKSNQSTFREQQNTHQIDFLLQRIGKYFEMMRSIDSISILKNSHIKNEQQKIQNLMHHNDQIHEKCVRYHDLIYNLIQQTTGVFTEIKCLSIEQGNILKNSCNLKDMKLTLDILQIDKIIDILEEYNFEKRLQDEKQKASQFNRLIFLVVDQFRQLMKKPWVDRLLQDKNPFDSSGKNSSLFQETFNQIEEKESASLVKKLYENFKNVLQFYHDRFDKEEIEQEKYLSEEQKKDYQEIKYLEQLPVDNLRDKKMLKQQSIVFVNQKGTFLENKLLQKQKTIKKNKSQVNNEQQKKKTNQQQATKKQNKLNESQEVLETESPYTKQKISVKTKQQGQNQSSFKRVGAFRESADIIIKSESKKKIYYQYDQLINNKISQKQLDYFKQELKTDPIACRLYYNDKPETTEENTQTEDKSFTSSLDPEQEHDFEDIIKQINIELQYVYKQIQLKQFETLNRNIGAQNKKNYSRQKILPVDCVRIDAYSPPQLNIIPLKLLMLRNQEILAFQILSQSLKYISNFYGLQHIQQDFDSQQKQKLDIRLNFQKDQQIQCVFENQQKNRIQDILIEELDKIMMQQENDKEDDKQFIDAQFNNKLYLHMKFTLMSGKNENQFLKEINQLYNDEINNAILEAQNESQVEILALKEQIDELQQAKRKSNSKSFDKMSQKNKQQQKIMHQVGNEDNGSQGSLLIDDVFDSKDEKNSQTESKNKKADMIFVNEYENLGIQKLARQGELIKKGMQTYSQEVLDEMDKKIGELNYSKDGQYRNIKNGVIMVTGCNAVNPLEKNRKKIVVAFDLQHRNEQFGKEQGSTLRDNYLSQFIEQNDIKKYEKKNAFTQTNQDIETLPLNSKHDESRNMNILLEISNQSEIKYSLENENLRVQKEVAIQKKNFDNKVNFVDQSTETQVSMQDINLFLDIKKRSQKKIQVLEKEITEMKQENKMFKQKLDQKKQILNDAHVYIKQSDLIDSNSQDSQRKYLKTSQDFYRSLSSQMYNNRKSVHKNFIKNQNFQQNIVQINISADQNSKKNTKSLFQTPLQSHNLQNIHPNILQIALKLVMNFQFIQHLIKNSKYLNLSKEKIDQMKDNDKNGNLLNTNIQNDFFNNLESENPSEKNFIENIVKILNNKQQNGSNQSQITDQDFMNMESQKNIIDFYTRNVQSQNMFHKNHDLRVKQKDILNEKYKKRNNKFVTEKTEKQSFSNNTPIKTSYSVFEKQNEQNVFLKAQQLIKNKFEINQANLQKSSYDQGSPSHSNNLMDQFKAYENIQASIQQEDLQQYQIKRQTDQIEYSEENIVSTDRKTSLKNENLYKDNHEQISNAKLRINKQKINGFKDSRQKSALIKGYNSVQQYYQFISKNDQNQKTQNLDYQKGKISVQDQEEKFIQTKMDFNKVQMQRDLETRFKQINFDNSRQPSKLQLIKTNQSVNNFNNKNNQIENNFLQSLYMTSISGSTSLFANQKNNQQLPNNPQFLEQPNPLQKYKQSFSKTPKSFANLNKKYEQEKNQSIIVQNKMNQKIKKIESNKLNLLNVETQKLQTSQGSKSFKILSGQKQVVASNFSANSQFIIKNQASVGYNDRLNQDF